MIYVSLLKTVQQKSAIPPYRQWFEDAWVRAGGETRRNNVPNRIRQIAMKTGLTFSSERLKSKREAVFIFGGCYPDTISFPFQYRYEIIPYLIDTWPEYWPRLFRFIRRNNVKICFVSQRQMCAEIEARFPSVQVFHMPEGVCTTAYSAGLELKERNTDVLELGRRHLKVHDLIVRAKINGLRRHLFETNRLVFATDEAFIRGLADSKIALCFPQSMTHPKRTGGIETLTLRYWECMLARTIILGRAPRELVSLIGYNPVVEIDFDRVPQQIEDILTRIESYQPSVEANYQAALKYGSWDIRIAEIQRILSTRGYQLNGCSAFSEKRG